MPAKLSNNLNESVESNIADGERTLELMQEDEADGQDGYDQQDCASIRWEA